MIPTTYGFLNSNSFLLRHLTRRKPCLADTEQIPGICLGYKVILQRECHVSVERVKGSRKKRKTSVVTSQLVFLQRRSSGIPKLPQVRVLTPWN